MPPVSKLAYLTNLGKVRVRMTAKGTDYDVLMAAIEAEHKKLLPLLGAIVYGTEDEETIEEVVAKLLKAKGLQVSIRSHAIKIYQ